MGIKVESVPLRSGTTAEWAATALILGVGELGLDTTTDELKSGDGVTAFASLPTVGGGGSDFRATDVANLISLGVVSATDLTPVHAVLVADDRYGALPDWCEDVGGGNFRLWLDAGSVAIVAYDSSSMDFSETTPPEAPGIINVSVTVKLDNNQITTGQQVADGDGEDIQTLEAIAVDQFGGGVMSILVEASASDAEAAPVTDGVVTHNVYIKLTREAFSPVPIP